MSADIVDINQPPPQEPETIWNRLDDLHTRLYTLRKAVDYIADHAPDDATCMFYLIGDTIEREYEELGRMLAERPDLGRAS